MIYFSTKAVAAVVALSAFPSISAAGCNIAIGAKMGNGNGGKSGDKRVVDFSNLPKSCHASNEISVTLLSGKVKTFKKNPGSSNAHFHGESDEDGSSLEYILSGPNSNVVFGSLVDVTDSTVSQFSADALGQPVVDIISTNDFPDEADPVLDDYQRVLEEMPEKTSLSNLRGKKLSSETPGKTSLQFFHDGSRKLGDDNGGNLDVLVVWTANAECRNSGLARGCERTPQTKSNIEATINLAVTETNTAYDLSSVATQLNLVHAEYIEYTETSNAYNDALGQLKSTTDGIMDNVHALRTLYGADLVAMIIDDPQYCGIAYLGPSQSLMFSVTAWNCATGYYSFGNEIGHNLGCNHDKGTKDACSSSATNYGYRDPSADFRSILAYNCASGQCDENAGGGCTRVQRFSNPYNLYNGKIIGDTSTNNAKKINDVKATIAAYYAHVSTVVSSPAPSQALTTTQTPTKQPSTAPSQAPTSTNSPTSKPSVSPSKTPTVTPKSQSPTQYDTCNDYEGNGSCKKIPGCIWNGNVCSSSGGNSPPSPTPPSPTPPLPTPPNSCGSINRKECKDTVGCEWLKGICVIQT